MAGTESKASCDLTANSMVAWSEMNGNSGNSGSTSSIGRFLNFG